MAAPAGKRRRRSCGLPAVVEEALRDSRVCREAGGVKVLGLSGALLPAPVGPPANALEAFVRSPHSLQADAADHAELLAPPRPVHRELAPDAPRRAYRRRQDDLKTVVHWGQRKLLLSEIEFLTRHGGSCRRVVYAGAAPGVHTPFLRSLFPHLEFVLVDPGEFKVTDGEAGIRVRREFFTDSVARELWEEGKESETLFISDVRTADSKVQDSAQVEAAVAQDMAMQQEWVRILRPHMAMLKFRLPYTAGITEYLDGQIFLPVWGPVTTTEARLVTDGKSVRTYDHTVYEEQMFYFNTVTRVMLYKTPLVGEGLCEAFDSASELHILGEFLRGLSEAARGRLEEELGLAGEATPRELARVPAELRTLAALFRRVGRASSLRGRHLLTVLPAETRERWFQAKVFDAKTGRYLEASSQEGQELLCEQGAAAAQ